MLAEGRTEPLSTWSNFRTSFSIRAQSQNSNFLLLFSRWVIFDSFVTPWAVACQAPLSMNISRHEYWSGLSFPSPGIFLIQGSNLYLYRQADSLVLSLLGRPKIAIAWDKRVNEKVHLNYLDQQVNAKLIWLLINTKNSKEIRLLINISFSSLSKQLSHWDNKIWKILLLQ